MERSTSSFQRCGLSALIDGMLPRFCGCDCRVTRTRECLCHRKKKMGSRGGFQGVISDQSGSWGTRSSPGIEPATCPKKPTGHPLASTPLTGVSGVTRTTTARSASGSPVETLSFSIPSRPVCPRVSMASFSMGAVYRVAASHTSLRFCCGKAWQACRSAASARRSWTSP